MLCTTTHFRVTEAHLALVRRLNIVWYTANAGAPGADIKRPYGNSAAYSDIAEILGLAVRSEDGNFPQAQLSLMQRLHEETALALQCFIQTGAMETGDYKREQPWKEWKKVASLDGRKDAMEYDIAAAQPIEPIGDLIEEMGLNLTVDPSGNTAILTYRHKDTVSLADLGTADISHTYSLSQNLYTLFTESVSEENVGEDETAAFVQRLIDWCYIPTSPSGRGERAYGEHCKFNHQEIFAWLTYFRRMRKLAKELRSSLGETDFKRIASADYGDISG